jgi:hypothetical protein
VLEFDNLGTIHYDKCPNYGDYTRIGELYWVVLNWGTYGKFRGKECTACVQAQGYPEEGVPAGSRMVPVGYTYVYTPKSFHVLTWDLRYRKFMFDEHGDTIECEILTSSGSTIQQSPAI